MKKISLIFIVLLQLCLVNLTAAGQNKNCYTQPPPKDMDITGISLSTANQMASLYHNKQANYHRKLAIDFHDTRSVWFSLDKLKRFIAEIENNVCKSQCNPGGLDLGVRVYFGDYPDSNYMKTKGNEDYAAVKRTYGKHQTIFLVPTYMDNDTRAQVDFNPWDMGNLAQPQCKPKPLKIAGSGNVSDNGTAPGNRVSAPRSRKLLILSTAEPQYFSSQFKKIESKNARGANDPIINHGNSIPPDSIDGTAF